MAKADSTFRLQRGNARAALIGVVAALAVAGWGVFDRLQARSNLRQEAQASATPVVSVALPKRAGAGDTLTLPGSVQAYADAPIYARANGYLKRWTVDIGTQVKAGQLLAEIDAPEVDQQLRQAEADLATAQANEALARSTADRWKALLATDSVSQQDADDKQGDYAAKKALADSARANVQRLRDTQGFLRVVAPFDGTITARRTDVGQLVGNGSGTELFHIADTRRLRVYVQVPQPYAPVAQKGTKAELRFSDRPGKVYPATIVSTSDALDAARTLQVQLQLDNPQGELYPGAYADVQFKLASPGESLRVPANALLFGTDGLRLATVDSDNHVALKPVTLGRDFGTEVEVLAGLGDGDRVVLNPPDSLQQGAEVRIAQPPAPKDAPAGTGNKS